MKLTTTLMAATILLGVVSPAWSQDNTDKGAEAKYFTPVAPGVVKDKRTGLEWMRCSLGQDWSEKSKTCTNEVEGFTFDAAGKIAKKINAAGGYAGRTNWRVPSVRELQSLFYCSNGFRPTSGEPYNDKDSVQLYCAENSTKPTITETVFPNTPKSWYWSSSDYSVETSRAWFASFEVGFVSNSGGYGNGVVSKLLVRLVR